MHTVPDLRFSILTPDGLRKLDAFERVVLKGGFVAFKSDLYSVTYPFGSIVLVLPDLDGLTIWVRLKHARQQNISETLVPFRRRRRTDHAVNTGKHLDSSTIADSRPANLDCHYCPWTAQSNPLVRPHDHNMDSGLLINHAACFGCVKVQPLHDYSN